MAKPNSIKPSGKKLFVDGVNASKRVQTVSSTNDFQEEKLLELSNPQVAEKVNNLSVTASIEWQDYGSVAPFLQAIGQGQWQNEDNAAVVVTDTAFDNAIIDTMIQHSKNGASLDYSEWNGFMFLTSFSLNYPADGIATESYSYEGDHARFFLNNFKDSSIRKADSYTTDSAFVDSNTAIISGVNLTAGSDPILLLVNQTVVADVLDTDDSITFVDNGSDTRVTYTNEAGAGVFVTDGSDRIRVIVSGSGTTFSQFATTPAGIGGLRRGHVDAFLYNPAGNIEKTLRVQSISIDGDLSREEGLELGSKKPYFRILGRPIDISIAVEINETDLEEFAKLSGNETAFDASTLQTIDVDNYLTNNVLEILIYSSETDHTFAKELKRLKFTALSVASDDDSTNVSDTVGTRTINLTSENFLISGTAVSPFL